VSLYHRHGNPLFRDVLEQLGRDAHLHAVVLPRTAEQRESILALGLPSLVVPDRAVDAQSLISAAAVVVSAGGTMNREAVALGTPVYTTFGGRLGAVDETLIREGRLVRLEHATDLHLDALPPRRERLRRDPNALLDLMLG
jgi:predicted glycosyltransferase